MTKSTIERGTGNVFADLGLPDANERQTKTRLALALNRIIKEQGLKQVAAASKLGVPQPKVSGKESFGVTDVLYAIVYRMSSASRPVAKKSSRCGDFSHTHPRKTLIGGKTRLPLPIVTAKKEG